MWNLRSREFLVANYGKMPIQKLVEQLGKSKGAIYKEAHMLGLTNREAFKPDQSTPFVPLQWSKGLELQRIWNRR